MRYYGTNNNDNLPGTSGNDIFNSSAGNDFFDGRGGNDGVSYADWNAQVTVTLGMNGADGSAVKYMYQWILGKRITWYNSNDTLRDIDNVTGSQFDDTITGNEQGNILSGLGGADQLDGRGGSDTVDYSASDGRVNVNLSSSFGQWGHAQGDRYTSIENAIGSKFNDMLLGNFDANRLQGMGDDDDLNGLEGADILDGGDGNDTALYNFSPAGVHIDLRIGQQSSAGHGNGDYLISIENVRGSNYFDILTGNEKSNWLRGDGFGDWLAGLGGADILDGGDGEDMADYRDSPEGVVVNLNGNFGQGGHAEGDTFESIENVNGSYYDDTLTGNVGDNRLEGFAGDDTLAGRYGADRLHGGEDIDTADYSLSASLETDWWGAIQGVTVNLSTGEAYGDDAEGDSFLSIENVTGSADWDTLTGDDNANVLDGRDGHDALVGLVGADTLIGGDDRDSVSYDASPERVVVDLSTNLNRYGHAEGDKLYGIEDVYGSKYNDRLLGDAGDNLLYGSTGADVLYGGLGRDDLYGGYDNATDVFGYMSVAESPYAFGEFDNPLYDTIFNFESGRDRLDLRRIDAYALTAGDDAFNIVGAFSGRGAELIISPTVNSGDGDESALLRGDVNGDAQADFAIAFYGNLPQGVQQWITASDIWL